MISIIVDVCEHIHQVSVSEITFGDGDFTTMSGNDQLSHSAFSGIAAVVSFFCELEKLFEFLCESDYISSHQRDLVYERDVIVLVQYFEREDEIDV